MLYRKWFDRISYIKMFKNCLKRVYITIMVLTINKVLVDVYAQRSCCNL